MAKSIVIDREYGSGGREIAKLLSGKLGIEFYDGNMLEMAGEQYGIDLGKMKDYDEKGSGSLLHDIAVFSDAFSAENRHNEPFQVQDALSRLIERLAMEKPCIFLGRCADEILKDKAPVFHVFVYASNMDDKVRRCMDIDGISMEKAAAFIRRKDSQRKNFRQMFSKQKWGVMSGYDLCVNTSAVPYEAAADAIISAMGGEIFVGNDA